MHVSITAHCLPCRQPCQVSAARRRLREAYTNDVNVPLVVTALICGIDKRGLHAALDWLELQVTVCCSWHSKQQRRLQEMVLV